MDTEERETGDSLSMESGKAKYWSLAVWCFQVSECMHWVTQLAQL
jgi:hypothetical protein